MHAERHMQTHARAVTYIYLVALHAWLQVPQLAHQKCMMRHHAAKHVMAHCSPACMQTNMHVYISNWLGMHCMASCKQSFRFTHISVYVYRLTWVSFHACIYICFHPYIYVHGWGRDRHACRLICRQRHGCTCVCTELLLICTACRYLNPGALRTCPQTSSMSMEHFEWILAAGKMSIADKQTESDFVHYSEIHSKTINTYGSIPECTHAGKWLLIKCMYTYK